MMQKSVSTVSNGSKFTMAKFGLPSFGKKPAAPAKGTTAVKAKPAAKKSVGTGTRIGGAGYRKYDDALWLPNTVRPEWLDGSLPGDRGFDPLGLSRKGEFVQIGVDQNDQNKAQNKKGDVEDQYLASSDAVSENRLAPYSEVFGLARFRECELIHGRWAMLATLGCIVSEGVTGISWVDAQLAEFDTPSYWNAALPFGITQLSWINSLAIGGAEVYRNTELNPEKRLYPGGFFDPLSLAAGDDEKVFRLKEAEIKHARLAMIAFLGFYVQASTTGKGALGSLAAFAENFSQ